MSDIIIIKTPFKVEYEATEGLSLENSFGTIKKEEGIKLQCTVGLKSATYGWYEIYDKKTGGESWYAEGELNLANGKVTGYDGCFALPRSIINKLKELGFNTDEVD